MIVVLRGGAAAALLACALSGCDLAPSYHPATMVLPASYTGEAPFGLAHPGDRLPRGPWWTMYGNPTLDDLEARLPANPILASEAERFLQARDLASEARSGLFPHLGAGFSASENRQSEYRLFRSPTSSAPFVEPSVDTDVAATWEIDVWGEIRNETRNRARLAQAEAALLASLDLSLQAELADEYILLRGLDGQADVLRQSVAYYQTGFHVTELRLQDKIGSGLDVGRAQSQLASTEAALLDVEAQRAVAVHAIATLIGVPAGTLFLPPQNMLAFDEPNVPTGVPSDLLERRPDVSAAERDMAAANAAIGVTRAAFYPQVTLNAVFGIVTPGFNLLSLPDRAWSVGAAIVQPLFEGGLLAAALQASHSAYRQSTDNYRATVLTAMQQVEDGLSNVDLLNREVAADRVSVQASARVQGLALTLYEAGADNYLDVVVAQVTALTSGITEVETATRALQSSVDLIRALGGGWSVAALPSERAIPPIHPLTIGGDEVPDPEKSLDGASPAP